MLTPEWGVRVRIVRGAGLRAGMGPSILGFRDRARPVERTPGRRPTRRADLEAHPVSLNAVRPFP